MCSAPFGKAAWLSSVQSLARSHCFDKIGHSAFIECQKGLQQDLKLDLPAVCSRQWELMGLSHCPLTLTVFASARQGISMPESPFFFFFQMFGKQPLWSSRSANGSKQNPQLGQLKKEYLRGITYREVMWRDHLERIPGGRLGDVQHHHPGYHCLCTSYCVPSGPGISYMVVHLSLMTRYTCHFTDE